MLSSIVLILGSLLFIGAGIFCILQPEISLLIVGWYIGFVLVLGGALQIIRFSRLIRATVPSGICLLPCST